MTKYIISESNGMATTLALMLGKPWMIVSADDPHNRDVENCFETVQEAFDEVLERDGIVVKII